MLSLITGFHVLVCLGLIIVVLMQAGKGSGMASVFGGGGGGSVMGGKGFGGVMVKATAALAILFMLTSITLSLLPTGGRQRSVLEDREMVPPPAEAPPGQTQPGETPFDAPTEAPSGEAPSEQPAEGPFGE